jgi:hypothetical protein
VAYCAQKLEGDDEARARRVKTAEEFRAAVVTLRNECTDESSRQDIMRLCPTIDYYDKFANTFLAIMADAVEISMLWGLLFLVVSVSIPTPS